jgi:hypothetical protein
MIQQVQIFRFLFERTGHLYKRYRARVAELKRSFEDTKPDLVKMEAGIKLEGGIKSEPGSSGGSNQGVTTTTCVWKDIFIVVNALS